MFDTLIAVLLSVGFYLISIFASALAWRNYMLDENCKKYLVNYYLKKGITDKVLISSVVSCAVGFCIAIPVLNLPIVCAAWVQAYIGNRSNKKFGFLTPKEKTEFDDIVNTSRETSNPQKTEEINDVWVISPYEMLVLFESIYMGYDVKRIEELMRAAALFNTNNSNPDSELPWKHHEFFSICLELANDHWTIDQIRDFVFELDSGKYRYKLSSLISHVVFKEFFLNLKNKVAPSGELGFFPRWFETLK